ncbi:hypothetical protein DL96DRAFT_1616692 [Flagelloscypha sp. PMI_526]|nr:hypothetical protein DL96DRAFT_1616692 [Flagelloscypha sp. PMI_526]
MVVDKMHPYAKSTNEERTRNWRDSINLFEDSHRHKAIIPLCLKIHFLRALFRRVLVHSLPCGCMLLLCTITSGRAHFFCS